MGCATELPLPVPLLFVKMVKRTKKVQQLVMVTGNFTANKSLSSQQEGYRILDRKESGSLFQCQGNFFGICLLQPFRICSFSYSL